MTDAYDEEEIWSDKPEEAMAGEDGEQAFQMAEMGHNPQEYNSPPQFQMSNRSEPHYEEEYEEEYYEDDEYYESEEDAYALDHAQQISLDEVRMKLEQARLYEMLINFDMFGDEVGVHPDAVHNVKEELKYFLMDRLEVLMGNKEDEFGGAQNFTALEVKALKEVAEAVTSKWKRKSNVMETRHMSEEEIEEESESSGGLRKLGGNKPKPAPQKAPPKRKPTPRRSAPPQKAPAPKRRPAPKKKAAPAPRRKPAPLRKGAQSKPTPAAPKKKPLPKSIARKHPYEMNEDELLERNAHVQNGQNAKSVQDTSKPMPVFEQEYTHHQISQNSPSMQGMMNILRTAKRV